MMMPGHISSIKHESRTFRTWSHSKYLLKQDCDNQVSIENHTRSLSEPGAKSKPQTTAAYVLSWNDLYPTPLQYKGAHWSIKDKNIYQ